MFSFFGYERSEMNLIYQKDSNDDKKGCIYLGDISAARKVTVDNKFNINSVLTVASHTNLGYDPKYIKQKVIQAEDDPYFNLKPSFDEGIQFIDKQLDEGNVLVHCFAGISRSSTLVCAYLMKTLKLDLDQTLQFVREKRSIATPNTGFMSQLRIFEKELKSDKEN